MDITYINKKIKNIENLLLNCTEKQKPIYQDYLEFWKEKITKSNEKPDAETIEEVGNLLITEEVFNTDAEIIEETIAKVLEEEPKETITLENPTIEEIIIADGPETEEHQAEIFEETYPNKRAYLRRNGDLLKTKAFKEFLINKE